MARTPTASTARRKWNVPLVGTIVVEVVRTSDFSGSNGLMFRLSKPRRRDSDFAPKPIYSRMTSYTNTLAKSSMNQLFDGE